MVGHRGNPASGSSSPPTRAAGCVLGATWLCAELPETVRDCSEAIGEVGGFSLTVPGAGGDDARLIWSRWRRRGLAWLRLVADWVRWVTGSMRNDDNAVVNLAQAVSRRGRSLAGAARLHPAQQGFLDAVSDCSSASESGPTRSNRRSPGSARSLGWSCATMGKNTNVTRLDGGYKTNVIPARVPPPRSTAATSRGCARRRWRRSGSRGRGRASIPRSRPLPSRPRVLRGPGRGDEAVAGDTGPGRAGGPVPDVRRYRREGLAGARDPLLSVSRRQTPRPSLYSWDFVGLFHGNDERAPVDALEFGCGASDDLLDRA